MADIKVPGEAEFPSSERPDEASRSGKEHKCTKTDDECHETYAAPCPNPDTNPVETRSNARKPGNPASSIWEHQRIGE